MNGNLTKVTAKKNNVVHLSRGQVRLSLDIVRYLIQLIINGNKC